MFFTQEDYRKIQDWLSRNSSKDSELLEATPLNGNEIISIVQANHNKKISIKDFVNQIFKVGSPDFFNVTDKLEAPYITLEEAISMLPTKAKKQGQVITFLNKEGNWDVYQFIGANNQCNIPDKWDNIFDIDKYIIDSLLPDEEDLTKTKPDAKGNSYVSLKDRAYNPSQFSGYGEKILRKHIIEVEVPELGMVEKNILYQDVFDSPNTIYKVRYDFDLNGQTIELPENCILDFVGGSIDNGTLVLNDTLVYPFGCVEKEVIKCETEGTYKAGQMFFDREQGYFLIWDGENWKTKVAYRVIDNKLNESLDGGVTWTPVSDYIAAYFRWSPNNTIQISRNNRDWDDLSEPLADNVYIKGYYNSVAQLPSDALIGDIYMVGTGAPYNMYINTSEGWKNNGPFTSVTAGIEQTTGQSTTNVMSQKAVTDKFTELESELNGVLLTDGSNYYETKKGQRYFFRNDGNNLPNISIYEVVGEETSLVVNLGSVAVGGIKEYVATQDAQIIYISKLGGTAIKFFTDGVGFDVIKTSLNFDKVNNELKDIESETNGIPLKSGDNQFAMVSGETYAFINDGSVGVNVGYKVDSSQSSSTRFITDFAPGLKTIYTATENSAIINISSISGASVRVYKLSDIGGQVISIENNLIELAEDVNELTEDVNGIALLPGKDTAFETKIGKTYYIENRSDTGFNLYYRGEDGQENLIENLSGGQVIKYEPKVNSSVVYISNITGAKGAIYQEGMKGYSIAELSYNFAQSQEIVESQFVGILLGDGINNFSMKKGNTYVFVNEGAGVNLGYQIDSDSEYVAIGNIPAKNSLTYRAAVDSNIIYLSLVPDVAVRVFLRSNLETIEDDKPILLKASSFNVGDFTGNGFETPSEDGKLTYHKLLGKIGANLMGTQEDVDYYGTTTSGGAEREDVKKSIYPMFKFYTRTGTGMYNFKGFASDYKIINIDKVYYEGDFYFTHPWFLRGDLVINGKSILVLSFHWEWRDTETRMAQIEQLMAYANDYDYVIAMGDTNSLNAKDGEYIEDGLYRYGIEWQLFKDAGYDMANNGNFGLFTTSHGGSPIDNIFVKGGKVKNAYIIQEEWMRDHYPIVADIVL